jgi:hypothetical protein
MGVATGGMGWRGVAAGGGRGGDGCGDLYKLGVALLRSTSRKAIRADLEVRTTKHGGRRICYVYEECVCAGDGDYGGGE